MAVRPVLFARSSALERQDIKQCRFAHWQFGMVVLCIYNEEHMYKYEICILVMKCGESVKTTYYPSVINIRSNIFGFMLNFANEKAYFNL